MIEIVFLLSLIYAGISGVKDAVLYSRRGANAFKWNEYILFNIERGTFFTLGILCTQINITDVLFVIGAFILSFSFIHNGFYYLGRKYIDKAYNGFLDNSTTSTATIELKTWLRTDLFIAGLVLITYHILNK